ncbi:MAG: amino acid permease [Candidatus Kerfeldbacteria bacterium]|nr:amino acid permease [Candidatus Kerfeldbacteria bacterium]
MPTKTKPAFWLSLASFVGVTVGAGIFALPYVGVRSGFLGLVVMFLILTPVVIVINLRLAEVVIGTKQRDRVPGYVRRSLGPRWERFSMGLSFLGFMGSNLAYLIIGGSFLALLVSPFVELSHTTALIVFFLVALPFALRGEKGIARVDLWLLLVFVAIAVVFLLIGLSRFTASYVNGFRPGGLAATYGVILFSLWALPAIPEVADLVQRRAGSVRRVIWISVALATVVSLVFAFAVMTVSGPATTEDALTGFVAATFRWLAPFAAIFGLIAIFTSYITQIITFAEMLEFDAKLKPATSYLVTLLGPLLLFAIGLNNFIDIIGVTGAVLLGIEGTLVLMVAERFHRHRHPTRPFRWTSALLVVFLLVGVAVELWTFFD